MCDLVGNPEDQFSHNEAHLQTAKTQITAQSDQSTLSPLRKHYENMPMQYAAIFHCCKKDNFQKKNCDVFLIFAQNIDCGYMLEPPHFYSNELLQHIAWACLHNEIRSLAIQ